MAIAFDAAAQVGGSRVTGSQSFTHTCGSITNGIVLLYIQLSDSATVSGTPTYGGNNMTQLFNYNFGGTTFQNSYVYYYLNPSSGANTVYIPISAGSIYTYCNAVSYSGVDQTNPFGSTPTYTAGTPATDTSHTESLTTTVDNAWLAGIGQTQATAISAGTNTTARLTAQNTWHLPIDTNGAQTPTGSYSMNITGSSAYHGIAMVQLAPAGATASTFTPKVMFF